MVRIFGAFGLLIMSGCGLPDPDLSVDAYGLPGDAEVVLVGEVHDNPLHHQRQARIAATLQPRAIVFEMIAITDGAALSEARMEGADQAAQEALLDWANSGWPDYAFYMGVMDAAPEARVIGAALPRKDVRRSVREGAVPVFGGDAARFGLDQPLPDEEQAAREQLQQEVHCNAMPAEMLPGMVAAQRLRDAALARAALDALETHGAPILVIAGNGHVRRDHGVPVYLLTARPGLRIHSIVQTEEGGDPPTPVPAQTVLTSPSVAREDPCAVFRKS